MDNRDHTDAKDVIDLAESVEAFGAEVRQLRKSRGKTLDDLSRASGISLSHLSAIERGAVNASIDKVTRIAEALAVPAAWFFARRPGEGPLEKAHVVRAENRRNLNLLYGERPEVLGYMDWLLSSTIGGQFHMGISDYAPWSDQVKDELYIREGEFHALVLEGELLARLCDETFTLRAGDSYSIPGHLPHNIRNKSDRPARLLWVNAPVIIPTDALLEDGTRTRGNVKRAEDG